MITVLMVYEYGGQINYKDISWIITTLFNQFYLEPIQISNIHKLNWYVTHEHQDPSIWQKTTIDSNILSTITIHKIQ